MERCRNNTGRYKAKQPQASRSNNADDAAESTYDVPGR